jgi:hypothetical protein
LSYPEVGAIRDLSDRGSIFEIPGHQEIIELFL